MVPLKLIRLVRRDETRSRDFYDGGLHLVFPPFTEQLYVMTLALNLTFSTTFGIGLYSLNLVL